MAHVYIRFIYRDVKTWVIEIGKFMCTPTKVHK